MAHPVAILSGKKRNMGLGIALFAVTACIMAWLSGSWYLTLQQYAPLSQDMRLAWSDLYRGQMEAERLLAGESGGRPGAQTAYFRQAAERIQDAVRILRTRSALFSLDTGLIQTKDDALAFVDAINEVSTATYARIRDASTPNTMRIISQRNDFDALHVNYEKLQRSFDKAFDSRAQRLMQSGIGLMSLWIVVVMFLGFQLHGLAERFRSAAEQLRESEERWNFALEGAGDGVWDWNLAQDTIFLSRKWKEMLGFNDDELVNDFETWRSLAHPEDIDTALATINRCLSGGTDQYEHVYRMLRKDGTVCWILDRGRVVARDAEGNPVRFIGTHTDITAQKLSEESARASGENLAVTLSSIGDAVIATDRDGRVTLMNPVAEKLTGWTQSSAIGKPVSAVFVIISATTKQSLPSPVEEVLRTGRTVSLSNDTTLVSRSGREFQIADSAAPIHDASGEMSGVVMVFTDVTQQYRFKRKLAESEHRFRTALDEAPFPVLLHDARGDVLMLNRQWSLLTGYEPSQVPTIHRWKELSDPEIDPESRFSGQARSTDGEQNIRCSDGTLRTWNVSMIELGAMPDGRHITMLAAVDVTVQSETMRALQRSKKAAESANAAKTEFLANMSHEIRTPLNGIMGMMQLLVSTPLDDEQKQYVSNAISSSGRLSQLLSDVLDLSRIEAGGLVLRDECVTPSELLDAIKDLFTLGTRSSQVELALEISPGLPQHILLDGGRLRQILFNLVGNALKFTEKGHIHVRLDELAIHGGMRQLLLISVEDTGIGIPQGAMRDIFNPFYQVDGSHVRRQGGVGLGLSIVRRLVIAMGGALCIDSAEGEGTRIHLSLPFRTCAPDSGDKPETSGETPEAGLPMALGDPAALHGLNLLLVEDDPVNQLATAGLLRKSGARVTIAANGQEGLAAALSDSFDCIIMDVQMPIMDGIEATQRLRSDGRYTARAATPVVAMTAHALEGDREMCLASGMDTYVTKPATLESLAQAIASSIRLRTRRGP